MGRLKLSQGLSLPSNYPACDGRFFPVRHPVRRLNDAPKLCKTLDLRQLVLAKTNLCAEEQSVSKK